MEKTRKLDNGMFVMDVGLRNEEPIALVERTFRNGTKEYIIAFNYEIEDNSINWGYGYYYSDNIEKAKVDFNRVLKGENLADSFENKKKEFEAKFYTEDEIRDLIKNKAELFYVDDGVDEAIIRFEDIPDFIVDYNRNLEIRDLKFFKVGKDVYEPDITTMGEFLNRIKPDLRERMIDRLVALQTNEAEIRDYKIIDEDVYSEIEEKIEKEQEKKKAKNKKNKEAR